MEVLYYCLPLEKTVSCLNIHKNELVNGHFKNRGDQMHCLLFLWSSSPKSTHSVCSETVKVPPMRCLQLPRCFHTQSVQISQGHLGISLHLKIT